MGCHTLNSFIYLNIIHIIKQGAVGRGRDRMVIGFTTTYASSAYHH